MLCTMNTEFGQRLKTARKAAKMTQADLAKKVGIGQSTIAELEKSGNGSSHVPVMAAVLGCSALWLATGEGQMNTPVGAGSNVEPGPDIRGKVPLISWVQAGTWCEACTPVDVSEVERWLDCPVPHSKSTFVLRVRGDSMTAPSGNARTYPEGCFIFVDPERRSPVNGDRIVACMAGSNEVTFKVFKDEDGRRWLQPLNPSHEPIREPFKVLGTVIGKWEDG